ncbi:MAG: hypothetical protein DWP97_07100 [Calditrichaeota bacterium]|nr:MAG: hypothetical protein DWP97_07100 [Calditrichota bacterium]
MNIPKDDMSSGKKFLIYHVPVILYAGAIIFVSSITTLRTPEVRFLAFDKLAHFLEYAIFAFLTIRSVSNLSEKLKLEASLLISTVFVILFAVFDEYFVQILSKRNSSLYDLTADIIGSMLILILYYILKKRKLKLQKT